MRDKPEPDQRVVDEIDALYSVMCDVRELLTALGVQADLNLTRIELDVARREIQRLRAALRARPSLKIPLIGVVNVGWKDGKTS